MDWLTFIASLVSSLAWPAIVLVLALVFRNAIKSTLGRPLRRMKAGPLEAEWDEKVAEALVDVAESPETVHLPPAGRPLLAERLQPMTEQSPRGAVMAAYAEVEQLLRRRLTMAGYAEPDRYPMSARQLAAIAEERGIISRQTADAIQGATVLRNLAAHGPEDELDQRKAVDFLILADAILYAIETGHDKREGDH